MASSGKFKYVCEQLHELERQLDSASEQKVDILPGWFAVIWLCSFVTKTFELGIKLRIMNLNASSRLHLRSVRHLL